MSTGLSSSSERNQAEWIVPHCHCEERSDEAIPIELCAHSWMGIAASLRSSQ